VEKDLLLDVTGNLIRHSTCRCPCFDTTHSKS
jgi:hypothetical protein